MSVFLITYDLHDAKPEVYAKIDAVIKTSYQDCVKFSNTTWLLSSMGSTRQVYDNLDKHTPVLFMHPDKLIVVQMINWESWTPDDNAREWLKRHSK